MGSNQPLENLIIDANLTINEIKAQIKEVCNTADEMGITRFSLQTADGHYTYGDLLIAKAQAMHALALLRKERLYHGPHTTA